MSKVYTYKIVLLGASFVGKTSIAIRSIRNYFHNYQPSTIGATYLVKKIARNNEIIKFEIWDTAGQERYNSLGPLYYRNADAIIIVFDITLKDTYEIAQSWVSKIKNTSKNPLIILVGNKSDLSSNRQVFSNDLEFQHYNEKNNITFFESSALNNNNIEEIFHYISGSLPRYNSNDTLNIQRNICSDPKSNTCLC